jgi:two-component system response regulator NreC
MNSAFVTAGATNPIRLLLLDDKLLVRDGVRALVEEQSGFEVVGQAATLAEACTLDVHPNVVITDLVLPDARGNEIVNGLRRVFARAAIFVLTDVDRRAHTEPVAEADVDGYMLKNAPTAEFISGVRSVAQGVQYVQPSLRAVSPHSTTVSIPTSEVTAQTNPSGTCGPTTFGSLTVKEREVLQLLVLGHTNAEIASLCAVSLRTVEARRARVLQKLGVRTRAELVRVANHVGPTRFGTDHVGRSDFELA